MQEQPNNQSGSKWKWALLGFLAVAAFFLFAEHSAHVFGILPFLLLAACPLLHLFLHKGHSGQDGGDGPHDHASQSSKAQ